MIFNGFIGGSYLDRSLNLNSQRSVNLFVHIDTRGGKSVKSLLGTAGLKSFADTGKAGVRGLYEGADGSLYAVSYNTFFTIDETGTVTARAATLNTNSGHVWIESNGTQIMIVDGRYGYIYTIATGVLTQITDADFPIPSSLTYQDGYFIVTSKDTGRFYISSLNDGTAWAALDFTTADAHPDYAKSCFSYNRDLIVFGKKTMEPFRNTGNVDFPFERIGGAVQKVGIDAPASVSEVDNSILWLDNYLRVVRMEGYVPVVKSTPQIEYQFSTYSKTDDAFSFGYIQNGHAFWQLTFPTAMKTWVYDITTNEWHERASYPNYDRHRANCYVKAFNKHLVGDYLNGKIYELDYDTYTDDGQSIRRDRYAAHLSNEHRNITYDQFELECERGVGLTTGQGSDPQVMLRVSGDGGFNFGNYIWRSLGKIGKRSHRPKWERLGSHRNLVVHVRISDPVSIVFNAAYLRLRKGRN